MLCKQVQGFKQSCQQLYSVESTYAVGAALMGVVLMKGLIDLPGVLCRTSRVFQLNARKTSIKFYV
jgi:hypothetical protein